MTRRNRVFFYLTVALFVGLVTLGVGAQQREIHHLAAGYPSRMIDLLNETLIPMFEEKSGIKVNLEHAPWSTRLERSIILHAAGIPPDVVSLGFLSHVTDGIQYTPLTRYIEQSDLMNTIPSILWDGKRWKGEDYVVPQYMEIRGIGMNKAVFGQAGLNTNQAPDSWEELVNYTARMTRLNAAGDGVAQRGLLFQFNMVQNFDWFMHQAGIPSTDLEAGQSNLNRPEALESLALLRDLYEASKSYLDGPRTHGLMMGTIGMAFASPSQLTAWSAIYPDGVEDVTFFTPRRSPDATPVAHNFINGLAIPLASEKKDDAWHWIRFLLSDEAQILIHRTTGWVSPRLDLASDLAYDIPGLKYFYDMTPYSVFPHYIGQNELLEYILPAVEGNIPDQEALIQGHDIWSIILRDWQ